MTTAIANVHNYEDQSVSAGLAQLFNLMGFDSANPLGHLIKPGDKVFIKPNWVAHEYRKSCSRQDNIFCCITHPSVIRAVADCVAIALKGDGEICIGDNPSIDANFSRLMDLMQLEDLTKRYDVPCSIVDLRPLYCADLKDYGNKSKMKRQQGDPQGSTVINRGRESLLSGLSPLLFRGVFNNRLETVLHHWGKTHEYGLSNSILNSDVYISIPKLKTHHKVGTTLNLKGLVGINTLKNYLVHWRVGWPAIGGDEYPNFWQWFKSKTEKVTNRGAWNGNDTIWRMVVDLYMILCSCGPKRRFSVVDGILGGQKNGPFCPVSKQSNVLLAGDDLLEVDTVASRLMGFNVMEIPYLRFLINQSSIDRSDIELIAPDFDVNTFFDNKKRHLDFEPPSNWQNLLNQTDRVSHDIGACK